MNFAAIAITGCLLAQVSEEPDRYQPRRVPAQRAPDVELNPSEPAEAPAAEAYPAAEGDTAADQRPADNRFEASDQAPVEREPAIPLTPVEGGRRQKLRPPELLAEALEKPKEGALVGTPITLQAALAHGTDRPQQLKIAQAYWRLSTAQADYHWSLNQRDMLAHYTQSHTSAHGTLSARASARADVRDAQLAVAQAQQELGDLLGEAEEAALPLASDRPHVGDYRTLYDSIFSNRQPPPRIRLIHRTLPVRRKAIDDHGEAIVAALDAVESSGVDFHETGKGFATLLATLELLKQERRSFMADVRDYNQEIAEYAFAIAPAGANEQTLVSMLIKKSPQAGGTPRNRSNPRDADPAGRPRFNSNPPRDEEPTEVRRQTAEYQKDPARKAADDVGLYQGYIDAPQAERVQKLANVLHWDRNLPGDAGEPTTLAESLRGVAAPQRLSVIAAFWRARERAARYQALTERLEQLNTLPTIAFGARDQPGMGEAGVRLEAARRAAQAAIADAQVLLLAAEFELTQAAGRRLDEAWLLPSTPPQSGRYLLGAADRGNARARHWSELVRLEHEKLQERADAVIQADAHRAAVVNEARQGAAEAASAADEPILLDTALRAVVRQNQRTQAFLQDLTGYNIAIARYALSMLPADISSDELAKKLAIDRSTRRDS